MTNFSYSSISSYSIEKIYKLIIDVEHYPEFLPWCYKVNIIETNSTFIIAELAVKLNAFYAKYTSKVLLYPPKNGAAKVQTEMVSGPFKYLDTIWQLKSIGDNTEINFQINFCFKSILLEKLMNLFFLDACKKINLAFKERADKLYGNNYCSSLSSENKIL